MKNIYNLTKFQFSTQKKPLIIWFLSIFGMMFLYMILFPSVQDIAQAEMEMMPEDLLLLFGMESMADMGQFLSYYNSIFFLILVAIAVFSSTFSNSLLMKEEQSKSMEFLATLAVSHREIYLAKWLCAVSSTLFLALSAVVSAVMCGYINGGETFSASDVVICSFYLSLAPLVFGGITFLLAGALPKYSSTGSGVVFVSYLLGYLGQLLQEKAEFLQYCSPFVTLSLNHPEDLSESFLLGFGGYVLLFVLCSVVGMLAYEKRDFLL